MAVDSSTSLRGFHTHACFSLRRRIEILQPSNGICGDLLPYSHDLHGSKWLHHSLLDSESPGEPRHRYCCWGSRSNHLELHLQRAIYEVERPLHGIILDGFPSALI